MSRDTHEYPVIMKPIENWQIKIDSGVVIAALEAKLADLENKLAESSSVGDYQKYLRNFGPAKNAQELAARMREARFSGFNVSQLRNDISICKRKIDTAKNQKVCKLNYKEMEWIGSYLDLPSILRRIANEIEAYYATK